MIRLCEISKRFDGEPIYEGFNLEIPQESITAIAGPSGCGKTTLLRMLAGLEKPDSGRVEGMDGKRTAFLFQEDRLLPWLTVAKNVELVLRSFCDRREAGRRVEKALAMAELVDQGGLYPRELSGGMRRRAALARALAYDGDVILMDEPFTGLDSELKETIIGRILPAFEREKKTVILVTHDEGDVLQLAQYRIRLSGRPVQCEEMMKLVEKK